MSDPSPPDRSASSGEPQSHPSMDGYPLAAWDEVEAIYAMIPTGLCVLDIDLRYVRINNRLAEINGLSVAEHLGKTVREVVPDLAEGAEVALRRVLATGEAVYDIELIGETLAQPGVKRTWIENWLPLTNDQGVIVGISIVAQEVTGRRQTEQALRESEERYTQLFNSLDDGFCVCELLVDEQGTPCDYRFLEVNSTFESHTGLRNATGQTMHELVPNLEAHWAESYAKVAVGRESVRFEQGSDVMGRWFDVYAFPFGPSESRHFAVQFKDISDRKRSEEALQQTTEELAATNEELQAANEEIRASNEELATSNQQLSFINADLDNFVYTASHDLKAPISNIQGLLNLLNTSLSPASRASPRTQQVLGMIEQSVTRFMNTIADLSDIARLQKQADLPTESLNLADVIDEVRLDIASAIEEANAQLDIEVNHCGPIRFAPKNLRSVVYNLLSNAVKYRDPQRTPLISVRCEATQEYQLLTVTDNGLGMDLSRKGKLFAMFQRFHDHVEGTGVGLYIVKKIIDNAEGKIEVDSQVGQGTTFKVFFKR